MGAKERDGRRAGSARSIDAVIEEFWALVDACDQLGRDLAQSMGLHVTDSVALVEIRRAEGSGEPLTPAGLASKVRLTSGATSLLLNRLEDAGHVERRRGHADRRRVTVHLTDAVQIPLEEFQGPVRSDFEQVLGTYSREDLELIARFVDEIRDVVDVHHRRHQP